MLEKVVSGGQTGVDRAALDAALELGIPCGGWCPAGRWAEDGAIELRYPLMETPSAEPAQRTSWNVRDSSGTLLLARGEVSGGTAFTLLEARRLGRPHLVLDPWLLDAERVALDWLGTKAIRVLNVAGPRESSVPGIYQVARELLRRVISGARRGG